MNEDKIKTDETAEAEQTAPETPTPKAKCKTKAQKKPKVIRRKYASFHVYPFNQKTLRLIRHEEEREELKKQREENEKFPSLKTKNTKQAEQPEPPAATDAEAEKKKKPKKKFVALSDQLGFLPLPFVHLCLPRSDSDEKVFVAEGRVYTMTICTEDKLPWGAMPRLLIAHFGTLVSRNKDRKKDSTDYSKNADFDLGNSIAGVLKQLCLNPYSDSNRARLIEQWERLKKAHFTITTTETVKDAEGRVVRDENGKPVRKAVTLMDGCLFTEAEDLKTSKARPWHGKGTLNPDFCKLITQAPVPLRMQVLGELAQSTLDMDLYIWLPYRLYTLLGTRKASVYLTYSALRKHFHMEGLQLPYFKRRFLEALRNIFIFYPKGADLCKDKGSGIIFMAGFPDVDFKKPKSKAPKRIPKKKKVKELVFKRQPEHVRQFKELLSKQS